MLTEIYVEALLVDKDLADRVWELWDAGLIPDELAMWAWCILAVEALNISRVVRSFATSCFCNDESN